MIEPTHYPPYLMKREAAAAYLSISVGTFDTKIKPLLTPIYFGETSRGTRYKRCEVEKIVDKLPTALGCLPKEGESSWQIPENYQEGLEQKEICSTSKKSLQPSTERRDCQKVQASDSTKKVGLKRQSNSYTNVSKSPKKDGSKARKRLRTLLRNS